MINGMHAIVFSPEAEKVRDFFADENSACPASTRAEAGSSLPCHPLNWPFIPLTGKAATSST